MCHGRVGEGAQSTAADRSDVPTMTLPAPQWSKNQMEEVLEWDTGLLGGAQHFSNKLLTAAAHLITISMCLFLKKAKKKGKNQKKIHKW